MKLRVINSKNFKYLVGREHAPDVLRLLDEKLFHLLGGRVPKARGHARPFEIVQADGTPLSSFGVIKWRDGSTTVSVNDIYPACGFSVNGTQVVVSSNGWTVAVPLGAILKGSMLLEGKHIVYSHTLGSNGKPSKSYIGMTKQGLLKRYRQHLNCALSGSPYLFHKALREHYDGFCIHQVLVAGLDKESAEAHEEMFVAGLSLHPNGFNMVPGGKSGLEYMRSIGALNRQNESRDRDEVIREFLSTCDREGKPNPLVAARWNDDCYATSVICGNPRNLSVHQVREARELLTKGTPAFEVASCVGIRNVRIVESLASGKTYSRVH